jgi:plastocyanin
MKRLAAMALLALMPLPALAETLSPHVSVTISDSGISPREVTVPAGGSVLWTNAGSGVHTATSVPGILLTFDTGGLSRGQAGSASFGVPGTYSYTSATDCLNGNKVAGFDCGPYTVTVVQPGPAAAGVAPAIAPNAAVTLNDTEGFQPASLTVQAGQTVVWTNTGTKVHTVTADAGYFLNNFDSGGLAPGQSFSYTFNTPAVYTYHSATEPVYFQDPSSGGTNVTYQFKGTITVIGGAQPVASAAPAAPVLPPAQFTASEVTSAPNSGSQYVQGRVLDKDGRGLAGQLVNMTTPAGGGLQTVSTNADGQFAIVLFPPSFTADTHCPVFPVWNPRKYDVWVATSAGVPLSNTRSFTYYDCAAAGEFHVDFVKTA